MAKYLMLQGTSSHVGKSILTTALCRIFYQDGKKVVPFKAQNMALNSFVTKNGDEMGRAQVAQAEAAMLEPDVLMNPILLKPTGHASSQVIVMGKPIGNLSAKEYHKGKSRDLFPIVTKALEQLKKDYELILIEGAGSPAEVNLKENDIVNMRVAKYLQAPVILIADIDRGGALASLVGTLELLDEEEKNLVCGLVINKFRGDVNLLTPALQFLEEKTGKPVLGVIPHLDHLGIDDEDSVSLDDKEEKNFDNDLNIAVFRTPKISNFTDFDCLAGEPDVTVHFVSDAKDFDGKKFDLLMLAGSKNTTEDLIFLRENGFEEKILQAVNQNQIPLVGICGGYQMLGEKIFDPFHMESTHEMTEGMKLLKMETTFSKEKQTKQVTLNCADLIFLGKKISAENLRGYEIHMGETKFLDNETETHPLKISGKHFSEGSCRNDGLVFGTYVHGIFDNDQFRRNFLNILRERKNLKPLQQTRNLFLEKQNAYNRLAETVRKNLDMEKIRGILS